MASARTGWDTPDLRADCGNCFALCCAGPAFAASADFAVDKPAGTPCAHLDPDLRCSIHDRLRPSGMRGCDVYDCFGAGQKLSAITFAGRDWRTHPELAVKMFQTLPVMRALQELVRYLREALALAEEVPDRALAARLRPLLDSTETLTGAGADDLLALDLAAHRDEANQLLRRASTRYRRHRRPRGAADLNGAELLGARLRGADLRAAGLRGACLIGADLRSADLRHADLTGADTRDADLRGADLRGAVFLTRSQLRAARGDVTTRLPAGVEAPPSWS